MMMMAAAAFADDAADVIGSDEALNQAIIKHDAAQAATIYTDDFLLTTSSGKTKTKAAILEEIKLPDLVLEINKTSDVNVRVHGDTAVLTGTLQQKGSVKGTAFDVKLLVTDTWIRVGGKWMLLAGHATVIKT